MSKDYTLSQHCVVAATGFVLTIEYKTERKKENGLRENNHNFA